MPSPPRNAHRLAAQAQAAKMRGVVKHFALIDKDKKGFVTKADVEAFRKADAKKAGEL